MKPTKFWFVWNEQRGLPTHKHWTPGEAKQEAERLARANPGQHFHVLQLIGTCAHNTVSWQFPDVRNEHDMEDAIPF